MVKIIKKLEDFNAAQDSWHMKNLGKKEISSSIRENIIKHWITTNVHIHSSVGLNIVSHLMSQEFHQLIHRKVWMNFQIMAPKLKFPLDKRKMMLLMLLETLKKNTNNFSLHIMTIMSKNVMVKN